MTSKAHRGGGSMPRIDDAIQVVDDLEWGAVHGGDDPSTLEIIEALYAADHLLPDLPEPTYGVARGIPTWVGADGDEIALYEDGTIGVESRDRAPEQSRDLAYRLIAAANYAEENQ